MRRMLLIARGVQRSVAKVPRKVSFIVWLIAWVWVLPPGACESSAAPPPKPSTWQHSLATQFASKTIGDPVVRGVKFDRYQGEKFYCTGQKTNPLGWGVAHRTLPCGSIVQVCKKGLCVTAPVITTGPFWAVPMTCGPRWSQKCWSQGKAIVRRVLRSHAWRFAGDLDLLPRVAFAIRLGGKGIVKWRVLHIPVRVQRRLAR
jgi:hypothetical protein